MGELYSLGFANIVLVVCLVALVLTRRTREPSHIKAMFAAQSELVAAQEEAIAALKRQVGAQATLIETYQTSLDYYQTLASPSSRPG